MTEVRRGRKGVCVTSTLRLQLRETKSSRAPREVGGFMPARRPRFSAPIAGWKQGVST